MTLVRRDTPMTVAEFFAFTNTRPDGETWELIDGEPVRNPSPSRNHQKIMLNLIRGALEGEGIRFIGNDADGFGVLRKPVASAAVSSAAPPSCS